MTTAARELGLKLTKPRAGQGGKTLQTAMTDLGLTPSDLNDVNGALLKVSDSLKRIGANARTIGDISEILGGRSGAGLIPMLANLRELERQVSFLIDRSTGVTITAMKLHASAIGFLVGLAMLAGCASTTVNQQTPMTAPGLARPNQIWVYDFVAASSDMPTGSSLVGQVGAPSTPPTPQEVETGREYGAMIAQQLVKDIQAMGMPAIEAGPGSSPQIGDGVIRGYIVSTEGGGGGNMVKRMVIGFGSGTAEMDTVVEGYVMTSQGLRKLGSGTLTSAGNKSPGLIVPAAVAIAAANPVGLIVIGGAKIYGAASGRTGLEGRAKSTADEIAAQLRIRFQDRGWIAQD